MHYKELKNKTAIITGSYGDIGNSIAKQFILNGINVHVV